MKRPSNLPPGTTDADLDAERSESEFRTRCIECKGFLPYASEHETVELQDMLMEVSFRVCKKCGLKNIDDAWPARDHYTVNDNAA